MEHHPLVARLIGLLEDSDSVLTGTLSGDLVRGFSAYDIAKQLGFNGTVEDWLSSLIGESVEVTVLTNTENNYVLQFKTAKETLITPNLRANFDITPITNADIESIF